MAVFIVLIAFVCCIICVPVVIRIAEHWGLFDPPGPLKLHTHHLPRIGGVAVVLAFSLGVYISGARSWQYFLAALFLLWLTGMIDDLRGLSPLARLGAQALVAFALCRGADLNLSLPGGKALQWIVASLFVMTLINAFNLLDGADGVATGVAAIIGAGYLVYGMQPGISRAAAAALLGSCLGFLVFNYPPARIFLGDSGSTSLGLIIAFTGLELHQGAPTMKSGLLVPPVFAGLPLLDLCFAIFRRLRSGGCPLIGDRRHFYDLLLQRGWSARKVALSTYAITAGFVMVGLACDRYSPMISVGLVLSVTIPFLLTAIRLGALSPAA